MRGTSKLEITMGKQRKTWSTDVKEAIVLSVLRGELGVAEAARQHGANESLIHTWKTQFLGQAVPVICQGFGGASVRDGGLLLEGRR